MEEIESSLNAHKKYFNDIAEMKRRRQQAGLRNNDLNYIEKNVDGIDDIFEVKANQQEARKNVDNKIEMAKLRRLEIEEQKEA